MAFGITKGSCLSVHGADHRISPIPGYTHNLIPNLRLNREMALRGLYTARFITSTDMLVVVNVAIAPRPTNSANYLRLLSVEWNDHQQRRPEWGLAVEGDPFTINVTQTRGMIIRHLKGPDLSQVERSGRLIEATLEGLRAYGAIDGNAVELGRITKFFQSGLLDQIAGAVLNDRSPTEAISHCDSNSLEFVDDLNYEIALGIPEETDPPPQGEAPDRTSGPVDGLAKANPDPGDSIPPGLKLALRKLPEYTVRKLIDDLTAVDHGSTLKEFGLGPQYREFLSFLPQAVKYVPRRGGTLLGAAFVGPPYDDPDNVSDRIGYENLVFQPGDAFPKGNIDYQDPGGFRFAGAFMVLPKLHQHVEWNLKLIKLVDKHGSMGSCGDPISWSELDRTED